MALVRRREGIPYGMGMDSSLPADLQTVVDQIGNADRDARALLARLTEEQGTWRIQAGSWSVAECLDHLATANDVYLRAMEPAAVRARAQGRRRRGPATPGLIGRWFVSTLEPPVKSRSKLKAPQKIRPRSECSLADASARFFASQEKVRAFVREYAELDLARVRFVNPFVRGLRFSLATGLHVIAAHDRRHLLQAWRVRQAAEHTARV